MQPPNIGRDKGEGEHMARIKSYEELTFSDDFMFCKVLENNKELCRELIELILDTKIRIIENVSRQKPIEITPDGRGIRLDVCMQGDDTVYNLEMQNTDKKDLQFRARYSQSMLDLDMMERGSEFRELKNSCIIFICAFDPFGARLSKYSIKQTIVEAPTQEYNDGTLKVFLSTLPDARGEISEGLRDFLRYVNGSAPASPFAKRLEAAVQQARSQAGWRKEYMLIEEKYRDYLKEGRAEGREEGREEGRHMIQELYQKMKADNRLDEYLKSMEDEVLMTSLFEEYGIRPQ